MNSVSEMHTAYPMHPHWKIGFLTVKLGNKSTDAERARYVVLCGHSAVLVTSAVQVNQLQIDFDDDLPAVKVVEVHEGLGFGVPHAAETSEEVEIEKDRATALGGLAQDLERQLRRGHVGIDALSMRKAILIVFSGHHHGLELWTLEVSPSEEKLRVQSGLRHSNKLSACQCSLSN